uniref:Uncharacterized protein n=1 Tax=Oryza punctata TaxID=4537 RepID=A0A0E0JVE5_ORYPU
MASAAWSKASDWKLPFRGRADYVTASPPPSSSRIRRPRRRTAGAGSSQCRGRTAHSSHVTEVHSSHRIPFPSTTSATASCVSLSCTKYLAGGPAASLAATSCGMRGNSPCSPASRFIG